MSATPSRTPLPAPIIGQPLDSRGWFTAPWAQWFSQTVFQNISNAQPSNALPLVTTVLGAVGAGVFYAREDHQHPSQQHNDMPGRDAAGVHPASSITNTPSGGISALTVQAALNELDGGKQNPDVVIEVNDSNYTITTGTNVLIAITAITAPRTVRLPPATQKGQAISGMDWSGDCSGTNYVTVLADGTDRIENLVFARLGFPYFSVKVVSNGAGLWTLVYTNLINLGVGCVVEPTLTDLGTGSVTIGSGAYNLFSNADGEGKIRTYAILGGTFALTDQVNNYVVADYNSGSPCVQVITNVNLINETTVAPIYTVFRNGTSVQYLDWDHLGLALPNKIHQSIVKTQRFRLQPPGLGLSEAATRKILVSSGTVWYGASKQVCAAVDSSIDSAVLYYHVAGVWTATAITTYDNTQYDDGTTLQTLTANRYAVNFVYRLVSSIQKRIVTVLGTGDYKLDEALAAQPPGNLPPEITSQCILVGRIIVLKSATTATKIDSALATQFSSAGVTDHSGLSGLQGGATAEYYHLTLAQHTIATQPASASVSGYADTSTQTFAGAKTFTGITSLTNVANNFGSNTGTGTTSVGINSAAGNYRLVYFKSGGLIRWGVGASGDAESGSDAGSALHIRAYTDAGAFIDTPIVINRVAGGAITVYRPVTMNDGVDFAFGATTGTKIGTGATQKIGVWGATPIVRPTALTATATTAPAGGTGATAGAYDTAAHRDTMIACVQNTKTRLDELETKLKALGMLP